MYSRPRNKTLTGLSCTAKKKKKCISVCCVQPKPPAAFSKPSCCNYLKAGLCLISLRSLPATLWNRRSCEHPAPLSLTGLPPNGCPRPLSRQAGGAAAAGGAGPFRGVSGRFEAFRGGAAVSTATAAAAAGPGRHFVGRGACCAGGVGLGVGVDLCIKKYMLWLSCRGC